MKKLSISLFILFLLFGTACNNSNEPDTDTDGVNSSSSSTGSSSSSSVSHPGEQNIVIGDSVSNTIHMSTNIDLGTLLVNTFATYNFFVINDASNATNLTFTSVPAVSVQSNLDRYGFSTYDIPTQPTGPIPAGESRLFAILISNRNQSYSLAWSNLITVDSDDPDTPSFTFWISGYFQS